MAGVKGMAGGSPINGISLIHERFAIAYLIHENSCEAARIAGYASANYKSLQVAGSQALAHPTVKKYIRKVTDRRLKKMNIDANRVAKELGHIATGDSRDFIDRKTGHVIPPHLWSDAFAATIQAVDVYETDDNGIPTKFRLRYWDKNKALDTLGKYLGMFDEPVIEAVEIGEKKKEWTVNIVKPPEFAALEAPANEDLNAKSGTS